MVYRMCNRRLLFFCPGFAYKKIAHVQGICLFGIAVCQLYAVVVQLPALHGLAVGVFLCKGRDKGRVVQQGDNKVVF